jgi:hypothetical protein
VAKKKCDICEWWSKPDREHETFRFLFGAFVWDVTRAIEIAKDNPVMDIPRSFFENWDKQGMLNVVNPDHIWHVDMEKPVILTPWKYPQAKTGKIMTTVVMIDGQNRAKRMLVENLPTIKGVELTMEQSLECCISYAKPDLSHEKKKRAVRK